MWQFECDNEMVISTLSFSRKFGYDNMFDEEENDESRFQPFPVVRNENNIHSGIKIYTKN